MKNMIRIFIPLLLLGSSFVQAGELLKLDQAIELALQKNHQVLVARNTAEIAGNNAHIGNANFLPKLDLTGSVAYSEGTVQSNFGPVDIENTVSSAKVQASWNIFNGLGDYYNYRKLKVQAKAGDLSARSTVERTLVQVISSYYSFAEAEEAARIAEEGLQISQERYQRAQNKAQYGQANKLALLNARVDLNADSISWLNSRQQLKESRDALLVLLDMPVGKDITVDRSVNFLPIAGEQDLLNSALRNNADYLLSLENLDAARYDAGRAMAAHPPSLNLGASYGYNQYANGLAIEVDNPNTSLAGNLSLNFNLFDGFKRQIQNQNAKLGVKSRQILADQTKLNLQKELSVAYSAYYNQRDVLNLSKTSVESARLNFERSQELFNNGQLTSTQFREAQLNLIQSENALARATYQSKIAEANLLRISGKLITE